MKRIIRFILITFSFLLFTQLIYANGITVNVNSNKINLTSEPIMIKNRVMIPLREISGIFSSNVSWIAESKSINVTTKDSRVVRMRIDDPKIDIYSTTNEPITITADVPPTIINGITMIPARAFSEIIGAKIEWYSETSVVNITIPKTFNEMIGDDLISETATSETSVCSLLSKLKGYTEKPKGENVVLKSGLSFTVNSTSKIKQDEKSYLKVNISMAIDPNTILDEFMVSGDEFAAAVVHEGKLKIIKPANSSLSNNMWSFPAILKSETQTKDLYFLIPNTDKYVHFLVYNKLLGISVGNVIHFCSG